MASRAYFDPCPDLPILYHTSLHDAPPQLELSSAVPFPAYSILFNINLKARYSSIAACFPALTYPSLYPVKLSEPSPHSSLPRPLLSSPTHAAARLENSTLLFLVS